MLLGTFPCFLLSPLAVLVSQILSVAAVTDGELDGDKHPFVGLMVAQNATGAPLGRCSGTLLSPTVFLTAAHCTYNAAHVEIWFDSDVDAGIPGNGFPYTGNVGGTPYTHPQYDDSSILHDVGVVILDKPFPMPKYGVLPSTPNQLDALKTAKGKRQDFTAVGYGLQYASPVPIKIEDARVRMYATPHLIQINTGRTGNFSMLLSNNVATGGTCFGDSGGPNFLGESNVIAAVTSYSLSPYACVGTGGVFRMDRNNVLDFVLPFLEN